MPVYRVYQHSKKKDYLAVATGFSMAAFFTSFLWAAANNLWGKAFLLFMGFLMMAGAAFAGVLLNSPLLILAALAGIAIIPILAGAQGMQWYCDKLEKNGYKLVKRINSQTANSAIAATKRSSKVAEENKNQPKQEGARFGKDFRDIRDNAAPNSNQPPPPDFNARPWKKGR